MALRAVWIKLMDEMCKTKSVLHIVAHSFLHTPPTDDFNYNSKYFLIKLSIN